jgi:Fe-S-cluster-containing dehydrogenase component
MKFCRREFLHLGFMGLAAGGLVNSSIYTLYGREEEKPQKSLEYNPEDHFYGYLIDTYKCIGCGMCVRACKLENTVPKKFFRTWVERYIIADNGEDSVVDSPYGGIDGFQPEVTKLKITKGFFVPKMCNHCQNTPCIQVCPVGASYMTEEGLVLVDFNHCIGCGYCVQACPYGSRFINPHTHTADKCTWCYHRISKYMFPACVQACPVGARRFGDLKDPEDEVRRIIATERVYVLQPDLLTKPKCYYLGLDKEVV